MSTTASQRMLQALPDALRRSQYVGFQAAFERLKGRLVPKEESSGGQGPYARVYHHLYHHSENDCGQPPCGRSPFDLPRTILRLGPLLCLVVQVQIGLGIETSKKGVEKLTIAAHVFFQSTSTQSLAVRGRVSSAEARTSLLPIPEQQMQTSMEIERDLQAVLHKPG
jgi:hypothetical protein